MTASSQYIFAIGRRKTAVAQVRLQNGKGESKINGKGLDQFIHRADLFSVIYAPLKVA
jgi:ribosomal protein S9